MGRRDGRESGRRAAAARADAAAGILAILAAQSLSAWFDTDWTPGVTLQDDAGTMRMTAMQSRPVTGQSQYTVSQGSLSIAPAVTTSANGKRIFSYAGAQYLSGAATLAAQFVGTAAFTAVSLVSRTTAASMVEWGFESAATDNRVIGGVSVAGNVEFVQRTASAAFTQNLGAAWPLSTVLTRSINFTGSAYNTWFSGSASIVALANTRAPTGLDELFLGCRRAGGGGGAPSSFWTGLGGPLAICAGTLSSTTRSALEKAFGAYYGYPF